MLLVPVMSRSGALVVGVLLVACTESGSKPQHDGGGPLPQGAVAFESMVSPGKICSHPHAMVAQPSAQQDRVLEELTCDLTTGCKPDGYVVVDRDRGANVSCLVAPAGSNFTVSINFNVDGTTTGDPSVSFELTGVLSTTGGTATVAERNSVGGGSGRDNACTVSTLAPRGLVKSGGIWGGFRCESFVNPTDIAETGCVLNGYFLFENCAD